MVAGEGRRPSLGNTAGDIILSRLALSFEVGSSRLSTPFNVGARVVLPHCLLPAAARRLCARLRVTRLPGAPPLGLRLAHRPWPKEASRHVRGFANTGGRMPKPTLMTRATKPLPDGKPFPPLSRGLRPWRK